jgi:uncharacterized membrane protein
VDLLDRYVQAVKFWLPRKQKQDILAELSEDIRSEIEDKEAELGRPVVQAELETILTRWGHPMLVAERYLPQRSLIGPVLLPAYKLVLTIVALVYLLPWLLVFLGFVIFDPAHRTSDAIGDGLQTLWLIALHAVVVVTGVFAILERYQFTYRSWQAWSAGTLLEREPASDPNGIPRSQSIGELVTGLIFTWWWLQLLGSPTSHHLADTFRITLWPLFPALYWGILAFLLAGVVMACVNLYQPWWTRPRAGARLAIDALGLGIALAILAGPFVEITAATPKAGAVDLAKWANLSWYLTAGIIALYCLVRVIQDVRRMSGKTPIRNRAMTWLGAV